MNRNQEKKELQSEIVPVSILPAYVYQKQGMDLQSPAVATHHPQFRQ